MGWLELIRQDPVGFLFLATLLLYSVIAHEVSHGWVASLYGDDLAKERGRLTLNPLPHIDPIGLLMVFLVGFGWARPVPVNYGYLRRRRFALPVVALAGPVTNILIATAGVLVFHFAGGPGRGLLGEILPVFIRINVILAAFNLIPIPPLDGSKVLAEFLPADARASYFRLERYGFFILVALLFTGLLRPVIAFMERAVVSVIVGFLSLIF